MLSRSECAAGMSSAKSGMARQRSRIAANREKIARLQRSYDRLLQLTQTLSARRTQDLALFQGEPAWTGERRRKFDGIASDGLAGSYDVYIRGVDGCADDIRGEIARLENENVEADGLLGFFQRQYNDFRGWWDKTFN